jgi:hypothetical protein
VIGISGACGTAVGGVSARHAVMWEKGKPIHLGNLGGIAWNTPMALNERGDVVGFSNVSQADGAVFNAARSAGRAVAASRISARLPGDSISQALGINDRARSSASRARPASRAVARFLWEHGVMMDLNDLVPDDYADHLFTANDINNSARSPASHEGGTEERSGLAMPSTVGHGDCVMRARCGEERCAVAAAQATQRVFCAAFATEAQLGRKRCTMYHRQFTTPPRWNPRRRLCLCSKSGQKKRTCDDGGIDRRR